MQNILFTLFTVFCLLGASSQVLKGKVLDPTGEPIPFAKVRVQNTSYGTVTNALGNFQLELDTGNYFIQFSSIDFESKTDTIAIVQDITLWETTLQVEFEALEEVEVVIGSKKDLAKEIMRNVIDKRSFYADQLSKYACNTYCITTLDRQIKDSLNKDSIISRQKMNLNEWYGRTYFRENNRYKDVIEGIIDLSDKKEADVSASVSFSSSEADIATQNAVQPNPYLFVSGLKDADINFFRSSIDAPGLTERPLVSPLANTAFVSYKFDFKGSFYNESGEKIYEISVEPRFKEEALFEGTLFIRDSVWELVSVDLGINKGALSFFKEMRLIADYEKVGEALVPTRREFIYLIIEPHQEPTDDTDNAKKTPADKERKEKLTKEEQAELKAKKKEEREATKQKKVEQQKLNADKPKIPKERKDKINGNIRILHSNYAFEYDDSPNTFWLETSVTSEEAMKRDTNYWQAIRPYHLKEEELLFIHQQDSVSNYHASEEYLTERDSIYNNLNIWSFLLGGVGHRNTFKKQEFFISPLIAQVIPFGVGGYRHRLSVSYSKEFKNAHKLDLYPLADYGTYNKDFKGELGVGYMYNPKRFSKIFIEFGDIYDFLTNYQSITGTFSPANRVRNRKFTINHTHEVINGLYLKAGIFYSDRQSVDNIKYPPWYDSLVDGGFGLFSKPTSFEGYKVFLTEIEFSYHFRQKYQMKGKKKIIIGSQWPILSVKYKKGLPNVLGGQSDFDHVEVRLTDNIDFKGFGDSEFKLIGGAFVRKKDLRIVEYKYFRTSDGGFFSDPVNSLQLLDTALSTSNSYLQFNAIHHFNGVFLNKIWGINKLKLLETVGGSLLVIPDAGFAQVEFYAGVERSFRIRKQKFRYGLYAVFSESSYAKPGFSMKISLSFYDSFYRKWGYIG